MAVFAMADSTCNEFSPCYREGYCDTGPMFCMWGLCNESKSYNSTSCWPAEGCINDTTDFTSSSDVVPIKSYTGNPNTNPFVSIFEPNNAAVEDGNLVLTMNYDKSQDKGFGTTVSASNTIHYGKVTARIKTAAIAKGTVTAFIIRNDQTGDEIDFEWVGKSPNLVETNFFYHDILDYGNSAYFNIGSDSSADYHDYTIDWTPDSVTWIVDGVSLRTLLRKDTYDSDDSVYKFPASAGRVGFSIWDGGNSGAEGTASWAGTPTPWTSSTVYKMYVDSITIECNADTNPIVPVSSEPASASESSTTISSMSSSKVASTTLVENSIISETISSDDGSSISETVSSDDDSSISETVSSDDDSSASETISSDGGSSVSETVSSDDGSSISETVSSDDGSSISETVSSDDGSSASETVSNDDGSSVSDESSTITPADYTSTYLDGVSNINSSDSNVSTSPTGDISSNSVESPVSNKKCHIVTITRAI
ncbi:putative glycosidase CRH2 [Kickxella alabastrina]|nr:putative glycosidase CRH2 [Kickxella alabastrina]